MGLPVDTAAYPLPFAIFQLQDCQPHEYQQARAFQIGQADQTKVVNGWLPETKRQHDKYTFWTAIQDEQEEEFWSYTARVFGQRASGD
ncbi:hypothetical protein FALCPG4_003948 [Fusarium falciforme]